MLPIDNKIIRANNSDQGVCFRSILFSSKISLYILKYSKLQYTYFIDMQLQLLLPSYTFHISLKQVSFRQYTRFFFL